MISIIVAYDKNNGIGANNDIPWMGSLPADITHFRETTKNAVVIMGWNTYKSIGRLLPKRQNIIISDKPDSKVEGADVVTSLKEAILIANKNKEIYIIGGGTIYKQAVDVADCIIATEINASFKEATVFFPKIDLNKWYKKYSEHFKENKENKYSFDIVWYYLQGK